MTKTCVDCLVAKQLQEFSPDRRGSLGLKSYCKACMAARARAYRALKSGKVSQVTRRPRRTPDPGTPEWELRRAYAQRVAASRWHAKQMGAKVNDLRLRDWLAVVAEFSERCHYCGSPDNLQIEHLVPLFDGGDNTKSNVVPACASCNHRKNRRTVAQFLTNKCWNNHEMTPENTYTYPSGKTACRQCQRISQARYKERRRMKEDI